MDLYLVFFCGQCSIGKSTLLKKIQKKIQQPNIAIRLDCCIPETTNKDLKWQCFYKKVNKAIESQLYKIIFLDAAFIDALSRRTLLEHLNIPQNIKIHLIFIQLRPGINNIIKWDAKRKKIIHTEEEKKHIINMYNFFQPVSIDEFINFNYVSINIYTYDNAKNILLDIV